MNATNIDGLIQAGTNVTAQATKEKGDGGTIAAGAASGAAIGSLIPIPVVGTAIGAAVGAIAAAIKVHFKAEHKTSIEYIDGLKYIKLYPTNPANSLTVWVLVEGTEDVKMIDFFKKSKNTAVQTTEFAASILSAAKNNPEKLLTTKFPDVIINAVQKKGINFNNVNRIIIKTPENTMYAIRGNQLFSDVVANDKEIIALQKTELEADKELLKPFPVVSQAGLLSSKNWFVILVVVLILLSIGYTLYKNRT